MSRAATSTESTTTLRWAVCAARQANGQTDGGASGGAARQGGAAEGAAAGNGARGGGRPAAPVAESSVDACAAVDNADASAIRRWLDQRGAADAPWFAPHNADDLSREIASGRVTAVLFPDEMALLCLVFDGHIRLRDWLERGVTIEFARHTDAAGTRSHAADWLPAVEAGYAAWRAAQRRRRAWAGFGLALLGLLAAAGLIVLPKLLWPGLGGGPVSP